MSALISEDRVTLITTTEDAGAGGEVPTALPAPVLTGAFKDIVGVESNPTYESSKLPPRGTGATKVVVDPTDVTVTMSGVSAYIMSFSESASLPVWRPCMCEVPVTVSER